MISMRSRNGSAIGSSMFAVVMNSTFERSNGHIQVVVPEGGVLFGIQSFEQRRSRIAAEVASDLVDFVEHEDRIFGLGPANALDDLSRQRADVSAPMAANLGLVVHAAQRDADELASQRARDRLAQRGLAHARRSDEAEDRALSFPASGAAPKDNPGCGP